LVAPPPKKKKKVITITVGAQPRTPCRSLFKELEILPTPCQYIFSLMNFILSNQEHLQTNPSTHSTDTAISTTCIHQMPTYLSHYYHRASSQIK
jgi:hypothetical protein